MNNDLKKIQLSICNSYDEMSKNVAVAVINQVKLKKNSLFCFAGGDTPLGMLKYIVEAHKNCETDLSHCYFVGLDEWIGLGKKDEGSCLYYLDKHLFDPLGIVKTKIRFFDGVSSNLKNECTLTENFIKSLGGIDFIVLGVGVNGHIGFNEPGVDFSNGCHVTKLDEVTKKIGKKYFIKNVELDKGITLGISNILEAKTCILMANGKNKNAAIKKLLNSKLDKEYPVTALSLHNNCHLFIDNLAYEG